ncbi:hypothetical protein V865_005279 [Kwoniella europaea PYCC6329]|uniref:Cytochrome b5 heme-binding domain-containing protein n=1 Tax=Kwoniella europaea PYCC6329 TaxID=1423913 RepID=A0AAX4KLG3_9TREE
MSEIIIPTRDTSRKKRDVSTGGEAGEIWWSNGVFFISIHIFALIGAIYLSPLTTIDPKTALLCFISWQLASFGHQAEADPVVRFQHRYYVPIALFSGLILPALIAHWGWNDWLGGLVWGGAIARLLIWHTTFCINSLAHWTGLQPYTEEVTARGNYLLAVLTSGEGNHNFHHAFPKDFRNGPHLADWDPSKWFIWVLHKYTSLVPTIARTPESAVRKARARVYMAQADRLTEALPPHEMVRPKDDLPVWSRAEVRKRHGEYVKEEHGVRRRVLVLLEGCVVDVGGYLEDHPGGNDLLLTHCVLPLPSESTDDIDIDSGYASSELASPPLNKISLSSPEVDEVDQIVLKDATRAFFGGMNNHSGAAKEWMRCLRVARLEK